MSESIQKYGVRWPAGTSDLKIEMACIRRGGKFVHGRHEAGMGFSFHYEQMRRLLWPQLDDHRWHQLCRDEVLSHKVTVLMGPGSSGKTHEAAWLYLSEYFCFPDETCVLVSSTDIRGLRLRVWGEITMLWQQARERFPNLPGHLLDSRIAILTDDLDESEFDKTSRDFRKGIIGIPCIQGGKFVGLGKYAGIKQKRMRLIADEAQFMGASFLSAFANLDKNTDFRAIVLGNPNDILDPLGKAAEPRDGWGSHMQPEKTAVWDTRFMNGRCVNLIGTDSPNFDYSESEPARFPYLISREKIKNTGSFFDVNSIEYFSQCIGAMKISQMARRVISRDLCVKFQAFESVNWKGLGQTKIAGLDAAYGGDRCVLGHGEFGLNVEDKIILSLSNPVIVPIRVVQGKEAEEQIAEFVKEYCQRNNIPPENFFHDSTGRGTLGTALARVWSELCNPVEFGGNPTKRPVSLDMYIWDHQAHQRRLKRCDEHYSKFVTELWFSVRYAIEAGQIRNLNEEVMEEGAMREWVKVKGDKIELETKEVMKLRVGRSPDLFDQLSIVMEGARQRGFQIERLANSDSVIKSNEWIQKLAGENEKLHKAHELVDI